MIASLVIYTKSRNHSENNNLLKSQNYQIR